MTTPLNPLAVVTGASSGIGLELAHQLAANGFDLFVCAEDSELVIAADALRADNVAVEAVRADLTEPDGVEQLVESVTATGRPVDALVINAGVGVSGAFVGDSTPADQLSVVDLNVRSAVHLAKLLLPNMAARGSGRVLFTSSIAAVMPGPFQTVYNASKAFLLSFAEALREELKDSGVTVTTLMPGPTDTEFFDRADMGDTKLGASEDKDSAELVAEQGYKAMMAGKGPCRGRVDEEQGAGRGGEGVAGQGDGGPAPQDERARQRGRL
ncbi:LOW QUALITY PROTEIN: dehydrogenase DhgA, partial [Kutzneria sp. 744]